jgi:hypothetical protein
MSARVWLPAPGVVLVHRAAGFPMPPLDHAARAALDPPATWPWEREDVWPCHHPWVCDRLATYRHAGPGPTRGYYCGAHAPTKPTGEPVPLCAVCTGPLDPWLPANGYTTHLTCDPTEGTTP